MEKKKIKCDDCGKESEYFDNEAEVMYHPGPGKKLCAVCFAKELDKMKDLWIQGHPCPFKEIIHPHEETTGPLPRTTDMNRPETGCILVWPGYRRYCVGEKTCPIYNGGVK